MSDLANSNSIEDIIALRHTIPEQEQTERERNQAEKALQESEELYRSLFNNMLNGCAYCQMLFEQGIPQDFIYILVNSAFESLTGLKNVVGKKVSEVIPGIREADADLFEIYSRVALTGKPERFERYLESLQMWLLISVYSPKKEYFVAIFDVITERKRSEETLRKSGMRYKLLEKTLQENEEQYRHIVETSLEGIWVIDEEFRTTFVNQRIADMLGYLPEEILGKQVASFVFEEDWEDFAAKIAARRQGLGEIFERRLRRKDGATLWNIVSSSPLFDGGGRFIGAFSMFTDITKRKQVEHALRSSHKQLRAFAERLQTVREEERTNIAREIHDELGGALTGLKIDISLLTRSTLKIENETVRTPLLACMDSMIKSIDTTIQTVRRIAMELRPGILDDLGLVAALEWQLKDFEKRTGIRCEFFPPGEELSLDANVSTAVFRIFQEALTNVVRHSCATEVRVRLRADTASPTLEVEDNGKGIEREKKMSKESLGLLGMRERAQVFGGRIVVMGTPGIGTKVTVEIPPVEKREVDRDQGAAGLIGVITVDDHPVVRQGLKQIIPAKQNMPLEFVCFTVSDMLT